MISIERACVTEQETHHSNQLSIMGANDYSFECETAVKNLLGNGKYPQQGFKFVLCILDLLTLQINISPW
jgi:hypothetical protein